MPNTTVLIVDNDSTDLKIFKGLLNGGFNSHCLEDSTKTIEQIEDLKPDVLIVDILMPDKDGYEILEEVKQKYPGLPVIATTAGATLHRDVYLEAAKALGADAILEKPIQKEKLLKVLDKLGQVAK